MTGARKPDGEALRKLALKLGIEIYDTLGIDRPDEDLFEIERRWHNIPTAIRKSMRENASKYKT
jgi:hypothetical protein